MLHKITLVIFLTMIYLGAISQEITGFVKDKKNNEPIPFSNVWIKGTTTGTMSDLNGEFKLKLSQKDTLCVSTVGYLKEEIPAKTITNNPLTVFMKEEIQEINEVTVKPEVSRAKVLLKKILERKKENRENILKTSDYKTFARTAVYVAIDSTSKVNRIISNMDEVTMKLDGQSLRFSPIYLAELGEKSVNGKDSVVYDRKDGIFPKLNQTIESLILLNVVIDLDFYKDQINILGRGMTSPLSNSAQLHYDFYLNDSTYINDTKYFSFSFTPKNKYNPLFTGRFTVEDSTFALTRIFAYVQKEANINFVNGFKANVNYSKTDKDKWFYSDQEPPVRHHAFTVHHRILSFGYKSTLICPSSKNVTRTNPLARPPPRGAPATPPRRPSQLLPYYLLHLPLRAPSCPARPRCAPRSAPPPAPAPWPRAPAPWSRTT